METQNTLGELWEVFTQGKPRASFKHAGSVHAFGKNMAINNAHDTFSRRGETYSLWVVKSNEIIHVPIGLEESFYENSTDKICSHPTF
jgi:phenylacetate-CoA oxygenase PaaH subunit